jgi:DMSO/TMAO reductase YedYZ molybdopterin-dependent catalytic subunit
MTRPGRTARPAGAPAYYLGRPASWWAGAARRRRPPARRGPAVAGTARQAGGRPATRARVVDPGALYRDAIDAGLVMHRANPLNAETPLAALAGTIVVPAERFYVRNHFPVPAIDPGTWRLRVGGLAGRPLTLSLAELRAMPSRTVVATLECAGNGRSELDPPAPGEQWGLGAAGTAAWTGVPLADVLDAATPRPGARELVFRGADRGEVEGRDGPVHFERSLPLASAGPSGALLAYEMNGQPLPARHGYPLRLIVPGWYGVASVKWLTEIQLTREAFDGYFQVDRYHIGGQPVTLQAVRSVITQPRAEAAVTPGEVVVRGMAWSGAAPIARVEVSIDGQPWQATNLTGVGQPHGRQSWQLHARLRGPGCTTIRARATDAAGRTQPDRPPCNPLGYAANPVHQVRISVRPATPDRPPSRSEPPPASRA